jgi:hypothetical protein
MEREEGKDEERQWEYVEPLFFVRVGLHWQWCAEFVVEQDAEVKERQGALRALDYQCFEQTV